MLPIEEPRNTAPPSVPPMSQTLHNGQRGFPLPIPFFSSLQICAILNYTFVHGTFYEAHSHLFSLISRTSLRLNKSMVMIQTKKLRLGSGSNLPPTHTHTSHQCLAKNSMYTRTSTDLPEPYIPLSFLNIFSLKIVIQHSNRLVFG